MGERLGFLDLPAACADRRASNRLSVRTSRIHAWCEYWGYARKN